MTGSHALVTGAGGFIGGHLVRRLRAEGLAVTALDIKPLSKWYQRLKPDEIVENLDEWLARDIARTLEVDQYDEVYHLAADMGGIGYITDHLVACSSNIIDTIELLDACHTGQRVFFSSSACVYPISLQGRSDRRALREMDVFPADPEPGYGWEKLYGELVMQWHREERGVETRIARYHNVYGPHGAWNDGREKAPAALCRKIATAVLTGDRRVEIWGDGEQTRSFMYVEDCVEGTLKILRGHYPLPLNLGSEEQVSVNQLLDLLEKISGVTVQRIYDRAMPQGVRGRNSDNTLIRQVYDWAPSTKLEDGLEATYRWIFDRVSEELSGEDHRG